MEGERVRGETGDSGRGVGEGEGVKEEGGREEGGKGETERWRERGDREMEGKGRGRERERKIMEMDSSMKFAYLLCTSGYTCVSSNLTMVLWMTNYCHCHW